jgi:hypothetical protein
MKKYLCALAIFALAHSAEAQLVMPGGGGGSGTTTYPQSVNGATNSGGIPYLSASNILSISPTLTAGLLLIGGGPGNPPSGTLTGLNVVTTLAAAVNAANGIVSPTPSAVGDVIWWNGTTWVKLAGNSGTTGYLSESAAGIPSWNTGTTSGVSSLQQTCPTGVAQTGAVVFSNTLTDLTKTSSYSGSWTTDCGAWLKFTCTTACTYTLPAPSTDGNYIAQVTNTPTSANSLVVAAASGLINGASSISLPINQSISVLCDATNCYASLVSGSSSPSTQLNSGYITNRWYSTAINPGNGAGANYGAGTIRCTTYIVSPPGLTAKSIGVYVTTADATNYISMAIYSNNTSGQPGSLVDSVGINGIALTATGNLSSALANTTDTLSAGPYWVCATYNSASAIIQGVALAQAATVGGSTPASVLGGSSAATTGYSCPGGATGCGPTWASGSGSGYIWPSSLTPSWGTINNGTGAPAVALQSN